MKIRSNFDVMTRNALSQSAEFVAAAPARTRGALKGAQALAASVEPVVTPVLKAQFETFEVMTALGAKRLKAASEATSLDALLKGQAALLPETKAAAIAESRKYLELYFTAKEKVDATVKAKVMAWVSPKAPKARKAAAPAAVEAA